MISITAFIAGVLLTAGVCLAIVVYLKPHLTSILIELCGSPERANFWMAFSNVTLVLFPLIFAIHQRPLPFLDEPALLQLSRQVEFALIGLLAGVLAIGFVLSASISRLVRAGMVPPPRGIADRART